MLRCLKDHPSLCNGPAELFREVRCQSRPPAAADCRSVRSCAHGGRHASGDTHTRLLLESLPAQRDPAVLLGSTSNLTQDVIFVHRLPTPPPGGLVLRSGVQLRELFEIISSKQLTRFRGEQSSGSRSTTMPAARRCPDSIRQTTSHTKSASRSSVPSSARSSD